jgi:RimJ/RimL family protein N-acetyltransferase
MTASGGGIVYAPIGKAGLGALVAGDLAEASRLTGYALPEAFLANAWLWELRHQQVQAAPEDEPWVAWVVARADDRAVIGRSGFHAAPDADGMVEISYAVEPEFRGRGYARAMVAALLDFAGRYPEVRTLRASISPGNTASLATVAPFGFIHVGEQEDEIDGTELVFERPVR